MPRALTLQTAASVEPITTAEAKEHLRILGSDEDTYVDTAIAAARQTFEDLSGRALITQTWDLWLDTWPSSDYIVVPRPPLQSVTSIVYYDEDDAESTFASTNYLVDGDLKPGRIILNSGASWPTDSLRPRHSIRVRFVAGQGDAASDVDEVDIQAIRIGISHFFDDREGDKPLPRSFRSLVYRDRVFGAV
jgi:uncharacterized phiE125 gp8 family phage protein